MAYLDPAAGEARENLATIGGEAGDVTALAAEVEALQTAVESIDPLIESIPAAAVTNAAAGTNITTVPATFADVDAVQAYLAGANVIPNIENRLDALVTKVNEIIAQLRTLGLISS